MDSIQLVIMLKKHGKTGQKRSSDIYSNKNSVFFNDLFTRVDFAKSIKGNCICRQVERVK